MFPKICLGARLPSNSAASTGARDLSMGLLTIDPDTRPSALEACKHPWLLDVLGQSPRLEVALRESRASSRLTSTLPRARRRVRAQSHQEPDCQRKERQDRQTTKPEGEDGMQADSEVVAAMGVEEGSLSSLPGAVIASSLRLHLGNVGASLPVSSLLSPSAPFPLYMFCFCQLPRTVRVQEVTQGCV